MLTSVKLKCKENFRIIVQYGNYISILLAFKYSVHNYMNLFGHSVVKCVPIHNVKLLVATSYKAYLLKCAFYRTLVNIFLSDLIWSLF